MAPEKTLLAIWIEVFTVCLTAGVALPFFVPGWLVLYSVGLVILAPSLLVYFIHLLRSRQYRT